MSKHSIAQQTLQGVGLSKREAQLYVAALPLGNTTALELSKKTELKRTTIYGLLDSLMKKGLMSEVFIGVKRKFSAENPERLYDILSESREKLKQQLPRMIKIYQGLQESQDAQFLKSYEGVEGCRAATELLLVDLQPGDKCLVMSSIDVVNDMLPGYFEKFLEKCANLPLRMQSIFQDGPHARQYKKRKAPYKDDVRILQKGKELRSNMVITSKRIVMLKLDPPGAVIMENKQIIETQIGWFDMVWDSLSEDE